MKKAFGNNRSNNNASEGPSKHVRATIQRKDLSVATDRQTMNSDGGVTQTTITYTVCDGRVVLMKRGIAYYADDSAATATEATTEVIIPWQDLKEEQITTPNSPKHILRLTDKKGKSYEFELRDRSDLERIKVDIFRQTIEEKKSRDSDGSTKTKIALEYLPAREGFRDQKNPSVVAADGSHPVDDSKGQQEGDMASKDKNVVVVSEDSAKRGRAISVLFCKPSKDTDMGLTFQHRKKILRIASIRAGSPASHLPLRAGDQVIRLCGVLAKKLHSARAALRVLKNKCPDGWVDLVVLTDEGSALAVRSVTYMPSSCLDKSCCGFMFGLNTRNKIVLECNPPRSVFGPPILSRGDQIDSINGTPCSHPVEAKNIIENATTIVDVRATTFWNTAHLEKELQARHRVVQRSTTEHSAEEGADCGRIIGCILCCICWNVLINIPILGDLVAMGEEFRAQWTDETDAGRDRILDPFGLSGCCC
jgi:hypothetical protein